MPRRGAKSKRGKKHNGPKLSVKPGMSAEIAVPAMSTAVAGSGAGTALPPEALRYGDTVPLAGKIKYWFLVAPSSIAKILISLPLTALMIWVLAWIVYSFHHYVLAPLVEKVVSVSPNDLLQYILNSVWMEALAGSLLVLLVASLAIEVHRVGLWEAFATALRWVVYVANFIYKAFRLAAEIIWIIVGLILLLFVKEGPREFAAKAFDGIKESLTETK